MAIIDGKEVFLGNKQNLDNNLNNQVINKGDVESAFAWDSKMVFKKTGKEIKSLLDGKKSRLANDLEMANTKKGLLAAELIKLGVAIPDKDDDLWNTSDAIRKEEGGNEASEKLKTFREYQNQCYSVKSIQRDMNTVEVMMAGVNDTTKYPLTVQQVSALTKSEETDKPLNVTRMLLGRDGKRHRINVK